ncbi:hypothetical protein [Funiculus sociatus]|uniref:hypothetical protein n=1 Tax=Funiculus sociatus TaxID=450527 RepID=UPI0032997467
MCATTSDTPAARGAIASFNPSTQKRLHSQMLFPGCWLIGQAIVRKVVSES